MKLGFINRNGTIITCTYGAHEWLAQKICAERHWDKKGRYTLYSDFLIYEKGYVLVNMPAHMKTCIFAKRLTKKQKDAMQFYLDSGFQAQYLGDLSIFEK